jgi:hypothetical protein
VPRRPPVALALLGLLTTAACSSSGGTGSATGTSSDVPLASVNGLSTSALITCRSFKLDLPKQLAPGVQLRAVTPVSDTTAAWGTPPITLRCGVPEGSAKDDPYTFNGVGWALHDGGATRIWTTTGRKLNVAVEVPDAYDGQAEIIGMLSTAVTANLK